MSLLHPTRSATAPLLQSLTPHAAIPGGTFIARGERLLRSAPPYFLPQASFGETAASLDLVRDSRAVIRVPQGAISSDLTLGAGEWLSNPLHANIGVPMAEELHLISNPAVDSSGNIYAMVSGPRGERVPVSIFRIDRDMQIRSFVRDLLNVSALAFGSDGYLYASSRSEGTVYRISPEGAISTFAEGMGVATGIAFDNERNLFVGDRSGTIFKINPDRQIFVYATLEPSVAAYHLAFRDDGVLLVSAPTTLSSHPIYAIDPDGAVREFFHGLGRPQGLALDADGHVYVAASYKGQRGIIRIDGDGRDAELFVSGNDLVGLCFLDDGCAALATNNTLFHIDLGVEGRALV